jgi:hypothetical protein
VKVAATPGVGGELKAKLLTQARALGQVGAQLKREVRVSAKESVEAALTELQSPIRQAGKALIDL